MPKRALLMGGAGFVGSHTTAKFLAEGWDVDILDSSQIYADLLHESCLPNLVYRYEHLLDGAVIDRGSTLSPSKIRAMLAFEPDCVITFAGLPIANLSKRNSEETFRGIILGTHRVLEALRGYPGRFVFISSSMAYGDFETIPVLETARMRPLGIYGAMKLAGEILVRAYAATYHIDAVIVRPSAIYGPGDINHRVVQIFLENARRGIPIRVVSGKDTCMDFTYVKDAALGIFLAATKGLVSRETFNITRGEGRTLEELVSIIRKYYPRLIVRKVKDTHSRPRRGALDISKARSILGYDPQYSLEDGVDRYISWMNAQ